MSTIYDLEVLLVDPEYLLEECFLPLINKIDIIVEENKIKEPKYADSLNKEREEIHLRRIQEHWDKCKLMIKEGIFKSEMDKIKLFFDEFNSKEENSQEKLEENIKEMKSILLAFHEYYFENYVDGLTGSFWAPKLGVIRSKVNKLILKMSLFNHL